ncbi:MAG: YaiI/YqxD family protein [Calditrichaeota bacterium]|nr:MAG: YaiI/YqxD family protein [Calditrichota bacterium]
MIWVDADACPRPIREILYRAARRTHIPMTLVANSPLRLPHNTPVAFKLVKAGADVADSVILEHMAPGDLVITADIPLAAEVIAHGGLALDPNGELYSEENVRTRLSLRNFISQLREGGVYTGGPAAPTAKNREAFARQLDIWLSRHNTD